MSILHDQQEWVSGWVGGGGVLTDYGFNTRG